MPRPIHLTIAMAAADDNGICLSQTPAAGGVQALTIAGALASGGVATMDVSRHVSITCAGNDSGRTFTVTGTDRYGNAMTEAITGPNATVANGAKNFATVTGVSVDDDTAGAVIVGTADELETKWIPLNRHANEFNVGIACVASSDFNATFAAEVTYDNVQAEGFVEDDAAVFTHATITGKTASFASSQTVPVSAIRFNVTAFVAGSLAAHIVQSA